MKSPLYQAFLKYI